MSAFGLKPAVLRDLRHVAEVPKADQWWQMAIQGAFHIVRRELRCALTRQSYGKMSERPELANRAIERSTGHGDIR